MSLGHGGQILVSGSLREVVAGTFFSGRGTYRLNGVQESAEVFQVNAGSVPWSGVSRAEGP